MLVHYHPTHLETGSFSPLFQKGPLVPSKPIEELVSRYLPIVSPSAGKKPLSAERVNLGSITPYADILFSSAAQKVKDINLEIFFSRLLPQIDTECQPELFGGISQKANIIRIWMSQNPHWLAEIRSLDLEACPLSHLPPEINLLTDLEELSLAHSSVLKLPDNLYLPCLKRLNLSHTLISELPKSFGYPNIHWLNLDHPTLTETIAGFEEHPPYLGGANISFPLQSQMRLERLDLSFTKIRTFPHRFNPPFLNWLSLRGTPFEAFNDDFDPPNLESVDLTETKVTQLPAGIASRINDESDSEN